MISRNNRQDSKLTPGPAPKDERDTREAKAPTYQVNLSGVLRRLRAAFGNWFGEGYGGAPNDLELVRELCRKALEKQGEVSGMVIIAQVADAFQQMTAQEKLSFLLMLANDFSVDQNQVATAVRGYLKGEGARIEEITALKAVLESPRLKLFRLFNTISGGIKFLIDMRADLLAELPEHPELIGVEYDLRHLLITWFNIGFLRLERITWETPAEILEKLIEYEAVHQITGWQELKHRLTSDRTAFAFFHPAMPAEPVIFLEAAIVEGLAGNIQDLIDPDIPPAPIHKADTAIFYSISNAQKGLRGIPLGNFLIKQVLAKLRAEFSHVSAFATLSPMPKFRRGFLEPELARGGLSRFFHKGEATALCVATGHENVEDALAAALESPKWVAQEEVAQALRPGLLRAARYYLTGVSKNEHTAACPVAHFHASNGALLGRINWLADLSPKGVRQSMGIMVNYVYDPKQFEIAQRSYVQEGRLTVSRDVQGL